MPPIYKQCENTWKTLLNFSQKILGKDFWMSLIEVSSIWAKCWVYQKNSRMSEFEPMRTTWTRAQRRVVTWDVREISRLCGVAQSQSTHERVLAEKPKRKQRTNPTDSVGRSKIGFGHFTTGTWLFVYANTTLLPCVQDTIFLWKRMTNVTCVVFWRCPLSSVSVEESSSWYHPRCIHSEVEEVQLTQHSTLNTEALTHPLPIAAGSTRVRWSMRWDGIPFYTEIGKHIIIIEILTHMGEKPSSDDNNVWI